MRFKLFIVSVFSFLSLGMNAQNFFRSYGNIDDEIGRAVVETTDSLFLIFGSSSSFVNNTSNFYLIQIDSSGNFLWSKTYGGNGIEQGFDIAKKPNGHYLLTGYSNSYGNGGYDILTIEIDSLGNEIWNKSYGGTDWDMAYGNLALSTGESVITGATYSIGNGNQDGFLLMLDDQGDSLWMKAYGNTEENVLRKTILTSTNELVSVGYTITSNGNKDFYVVKTQLDGDTVWTKSFGTAVGNEEGFSVLESSNGNYIFCGYTDSIAANGKDFYYFETDTSGVETWLATYGLAGEDIMNAIVSKPELNQFVAAMESSSYGSGEYEFVLTTYFSLGGWYHAGNTYGTLYTEKALDIIYTSTKKILGVGYTDSPFGNTNVMAVLTDTLYPSQSVMTSYTDVTAVSEIANESNFKIYPNPASEYIEINSTIGIQNIHMYDVSGRMIIFNSNKTNRIFISSIPSGIYFLQILTEDGARSTHRLQITKQ